MVLAVEPKVTCEPAPATLSHGPGTPGEYCLRESLRDETQSLWKSRSPEEKFWYMVGTTTKKIEIHCLGESKRNNLTFLASFFLLDGTIQG